MIYNITLEEKTLTTMAREKKHYLNVKTERNFKPNICMRIKLSFNAELNPSKPIAEMCFNPLSEYEDLNHFNPVFEELITKTLITHSQVFNKGQKKNKKSLTNENRQDYCICA